MDPIGYASIRDDYLPKECVAKRTDYTQAPSMLRVFINFITNLFSSSQSRSLKGRVAASGPGPVGKTERLAIPPVAKQVIQPVKPHSGGLPAASALDLPLLDSETLYEPTPASSLVNQPAAREFTSLATPALTSRAARDAAYYPPYSQSDAPPELTGRAALYAAEYPAFIPSDTPPALIGRAARDAAEYPSYSGSFFDNEYVPSARAEAQEQGYR
jgi:hypothetical protein